MYEDWNEEYIDEEEYPVSRAAERRKNDWKYAKRAQRIRNIAFSATRVPYSHAENELSKPLHYYAKNPPWNSYAFAPNKTNNKGSRRYISKNYAPQKNWNEHDKRQIDDFENQMAELFD